MISSAGAFVLAELFALNKYLRRKNMWQPQEDNTYNELRENSIRKWLEDMSGHEDVAVRGGVKVTQEYLEELKRQIRELEEKCALKDDYLKKMKEKSATVKSAVQHSIERTSGK